MKQTGLMEKNKVLCALSVELTRSHIFSNTGLMPVGRVGDELQCYKQKVLLCVFVCEFIAAGS